MNSDAGSFLGRLNSHEEDSLKVVGSRRKWPKGSVLMNQGDPARWVVVLLAGVVKVSWITDEGGEVLLGFCGPGSLLGELEAVDGKPRHATVVAVEPVEALIISHEDFFTFLTSNRTALWLLVQILSEQARTADRKRVEFVADDITRRLARQLVELADVYGRSTDKGVFIGLPLTQDDLASWIGASREAVSKVFRSLRLRGWVMTGRRSVLVIDLPSLRSLAR